ncbi:hypothetical protein T265_15634, partial [Opisthorchis viverrini]
MHNSRPYGSQFGMEHFRADSCMFDLGVSNAALSRSVGRSLGTQAMVRFLSILVQENGAQYNAANKDGGEMSSEQSPDIIDSEDGPKCFGTR